MTFESESDLREAAMPSLKQEITRDGANVVEEFSFSAGRTDLVFTSVSDKYLSRRVEELGIGIPITDKELLKAFLRIHNRQREITKDYYFKLSSGRNSRSKKHLNWLIDNNFVRELADDRIRTAKYLRRHITSSIAVELKLDKWKKALKQAYNARSYAEYQYVVLDWNFVDRANLDLFRDYGIGLASVKPTGEITVHISAEKQKPFSELHSWRLNEETLQAITG